MANVKLNASTASRLGVELSLLCEKLGKESGQMADSAEVAQAADELKSQMPPAEEGASAPESAPELSAYDKFFAWWGSISWVSQEELHRTLRTRTAKDPKRTKLLVYLTADGQERETPEDKPNLRLLSKELEAEGIAILSEFPNAPQPEALKCKHCKAVGTFMSTGQQHWLMLTTLESILYGEYSKLVDGEWQTDLARVQFPKEFEHEECKAFIEEHARQGKGELQAAVNRFRIANRRVPSKAEKADLEKQVYAEWMPRAEELLAKMQEKDIPTAKYERMLEKVQ